MVETAGIYNNANRTRFVNRLIRLDSFEQTVIDCLEIGNILFQKNRMLLEICSDENVRYIGRKKPFDHIPKEYSIGSYLFNTQIDEQELQSISKDKHLSANPFLTGTKSIFACPISHKDGFVYAALIIFSKETIEITEQQSTFLKALCTLINKSLVQLLETDKVSDLVSTLNTDTKRFYNLVENSSNIIYELDKHGQYVYVNEAFLHHIGYTQEEITQKHYWDLVEPSHRDKVIRFYGNQIKNNSWSSYLELPVVKKNGETSWLGISTQMIYEHNELSNIYASATDINERKWIENNLISSNEDLNALIDSSENIVFVLNDRLEFEKVFCKHEEYLHMPKRNFIGKHIDQVWVDKHGKVMCKLALKAMETDEVSTYEYKYTPRDIEYFWEARFNSYKGFDEERKLSVIISNISERKEYEEKIRISEAQYRLINENSSDLVCLHDYKGKFQFISQSVNELLGYDPEELINQHPFNFIHPEDIEKLKVEPIVSEISKTPINNVQYRFKKKDGSYLWMEAFTKPVRDELGKYTGFQSSSRNITKNKQDELKLEKYTEGLKFLNQLTSTSTLTTSQRIETALFTALEFFDLELGILSKIENNKYQVLYSYALNDDLEVESGSSFDFDRTYCHITYHSSDIFYTHEMRKSPHSGHPCYEAMKMESYIGASYFVNREKVGTIYFSAKESREPFNAYEVDFMKLLAIWIGFLIERDQRENMIKAEQKVLQAFVETAPAAIAMLNSQMEYIAVSERWKKDQDFEDEDVIGRNIFEHPKGNHTKWENVYMEVLEGKVKKKNEEKITKEDGESKWIKWEVRPWYTLKDEVGGIITFIEDITALKEQQLQLIEARDSAEKANKVKEQFYSTISHEIRTPLNAVIGMANLLLLEDHMPVQEKKLELLKNSGQNLMMLINDVLDFNKMESGKIDLSYSSFDLHKLASDIVEIFNPKAQEKDIKLKFNYSDQLPRAFICDSLRLGQVLNNLVSNAIKFTEEGSVSITIGGEEISESDSYRLKFEVKDTGIGIPEDKLSSIFLDFSQASNDITQKYGGTGLGLTISTKLIQLMGSEIEVKSIEGLGSAFYFYLDLEHGDDEVVVKTNMAESFHHFEETVRILIAEDNMGNQAVIESFMELWDLHFDFAVNGQEAVEMIQNRTYDLILMDLRMPIKDGYQAAREIRAMSDEYFKTIPIIALTASALNNVKESILAVGMNECVNKPFSPNELNAVIKRFIETYPVEKKSLEQLDAGHQEIAEIPTENNGAKTESLNEVFPYLSSLVNGNNAAIKRIVKATSESVNEALITSQKAVKQKDEELLRLQLHTLKPNLHSLGIDELLDKLPEDIFQEPEISIQVFSEIKDQTQQIRDTYGEN